MRLSKEKTSLLRQFDPARHPVDEAINKHSFGYYTNWGIRIYLAGQYSVTVLPDRYTYYPLWMKANSRKVHPSQVCLVRLEAG